MTLASRTVLIKKMTGHALTTNTSIPVAIKAAGWRCSPQQPSGQPRATYTSGRSRKWKKSAEEEDIAEEEDKKRASPTTTSPCG